MKYLLKNGILLTEGSETFQHVDILFNGSHVKEIGDNIRPDYDTFLLDLKGKIIAPGLIDVHVHFREPGQTNKECIYSGSRAAAAGGFTAVIAEPNTKPPIDSPAKVQEVINIAKQRSIICFYTKSCISKGMAGKKLADISELKKAGALAISDDGHPVPSKELMEEALIEGRAHDILVNPHCEESELYRQNILDSNGGLFPDLEMPYSGKNGEPYSSETGFIKRDIELARKIGARIHISHVSLASSVEEIRKAKKEGVLITAEATPHHLLLSKKDIERIGPNAKVNPPLRSEEDVIAVREGLIDGTIDIIATDHAPHMPSEKSQPWDKAPFGIIGLETSLGLMLTYLVKPGYLTIYQLIERMSTKPIEIFRLPSQKIAEHEQANLTIIDPDMKWKVDANQFYSKGRNCPFDGWELQGKAVMTIVNGRIVMKDGKIIEDEKELLSEPNKILT